VGYGLSVAPENQWEGEACDTCRDLPACFAWKQVWLDFSVWPQDWRRHNGEWCTWHHHGGCVESKLKMDGSTQWAASETSIPESSFSMYYDLGA
jgi:hypothetical protein